MTNKRALTTRFALLQGSEESIRLFLVSPPRALVAFFVADERIECLPTYFEFFERGKTPETRSFAARRETERREKRRRSGVRDKNADSDADGDFQSHRQRRKDTCIQKRTSSDREKQSTNRLLHL